jgi:hypothetical protein
MKRWYLFLVMLFFSIHCMAQTSLTLTGDLSFLLTEPRRSELRPYGIGGMIKMEWVNDNGGIRYLEFGADQFNKSATFEGPNYTQIKFYEDIIVRIQRGYRTFIGSNNNGLYTDFGFGLALNKTDGYNKSDGDFHLGAGISGGFGYCKSIFSLGMQLHLLGTRSGGLYAYPGFNLGFRIEGAKK